VLITEFARRAGVSARSLRHYEEQGLLTPARTATGYRLFEESDLDVVARIRLMLDAGLATVVIRQYLDCVRTGAGTHHLQLCPALRRELEAVAARLEQESRRIDATRAALCALAP